MMREDIKFIKFFFDNLKENKIEYCILRKAKEIIAGDAHDIDMAVDFSKIEKIFIILTRISKTLGWKLFFRIEKDNGNLLTVHYYKVSNQNIEIVHFDMFNNFSWNTIPILNNKSLLENCICKAGVYSCSKANEAITKLFSRLLYHGYIKGEYKKDIVVIFKNQKLDVMNAMAEFIGQDYAENVYQLVVNKKWDELASLKGELRRVIQSLYFSNPWKKFKNKTSNIIFKGRRYFKNNGIMVSFLGTDGSGKSTIIENLPVILGKTFNETQIKYYHWRPKYIKSPKKEGTSNENVIDPHKKKPYGKLVSFCKFMYFNLDYIIGHWLAVKVHLGKNELVIFDRYYYDYLLDKYRYRLNLSDNLIKLMMPLIPRPNITFLLVGDPEILYKRKMELPVEEVDRQVNRLLELRNKIPYSKVIDVNQDVENVVFNVSENIVNYMAKRIK